MIYRVTFTTELLVDCESELEAQNLGSKFLNDAVRSGQSKYLHAKHIDDVSKLHRDERGSLPWRALTRCKEPELTVEKILGEKS